MAVTKKGDTKVAAAKTDDAVTAVKAVTPAAQEAVKAEPAAEKPVQAVKEQKAAAKPAETEVKAEAAKKPAAKRAAAKKETVKKEAEPKSAEVKATAKPAAKSAAKPAAKSTAKTAAKQPAAKKAEIKTTVYIQYAGEELSGEALSAAAKKAYIAAGHKEADIKTIDVYVKPDERTAYFAINGFGSENDKIVY